MIFELRVPANQLVASLPRCQIICKSGLDNIADAFRHRRLTYHFVNLDFVLLQCRLPLLPIIAFRSAITLCVSLPSEDNYLKFV